MKRDSEGSMKDRRSVMKGKRLEKDKRNNKEKNMGEGVKWKEEGEEYTERRVDGVVEVIRDEIRQKM